MKLNLLAAALSSSLLGACGNPSAHQSTSAVKGDDTSKDKKSLFNLADYLKDSPYSPELKPYLKEGDLVFGDLQKIGIRTNVKVETTGKSKLTPNGARNISGQYYLNGAVYPDGVKFSDGTAVSTKGIAFADGSKVENPFASDDHNKEYSIVDIAAKAGFDVQGVEGHVRLFGDDKYAFEKQAVYENSFTRELEVPYPLLPGLNVAASIGGEIGFRAEVLVRKDDALSLLLQPKVAVNSKAKIEAGLYNIASLGLQGVLTLFETTVATSASVGYLPENDFSYGDISMDTTEIKALDGKVKVVADVGLKKFFPKFLNEVFKDVTGHNLGWSWEHTIWDPKPLYTAKIPARGVFFTSDMSGLSSEECRDIREQVYAAGDIMEKEKNKSGGLDADIAQTAQANLAKTALSITSTCGR